jgi:endo-1,4-beta-xylanase
MTSLIHDPASLRELAAREHLLYGAALCASDLDVEQRRRAFLRECSLMSPEYELKWDAVGTHADYQACDRLMAFAADNRLAVHGHTLWWHGSVPADLNDVSDHDFATAAMRHLEATTRRYAGRMHAWDVVNEPLDEAAGDRPDGLRPTRFLKAFGLGYISEAFRRAAEIDPKAILVLNEMGLEYASPEAERKRRLMLALLERERAGGTPIHCLGIQSHLDAVDQPRRHPELRAFLREIRQMGLSVMITELDVSDRQCPRDRRLRDRLVANTYRSYVELVLEESRTLAVTTWGLDDGRSWLAVEQRRPDGALPRPLPLDRALRRKPAWHALKAAFLTGQRA